MGTRERAKTSWQLAAHNCERDLASLAGEGSIFGGSAAEKLKRLQAELRPLSCRYDVVVANPPYMGAKNMNSWLSSWVKKQYADVKGDLFSCFMVRNSGMGTDHAQMGFMTPYVWMFIGTYEKLRKFVIEQNTITSLIQLEYSGFAGATVPICTFTLQKGKVEGYKGGYIRLSDFPGADQQAPRALEALANPDCGWFYQADADGFGAIPGSPIAYWASKAMMDAFVFGDPLNTLAYGCNGITTGENERFLRQWFEVSHRRIAFNLSQSNDLGAIDAWVPYNKGGDFLKWASHLDYVIDWRKKGSIISEYGHLVMRSKRYMLRSGLTWPKISSGHIAMRRVIEGFMFDVAGLSLFPENINLTQYLEAFVNSSVATAFLSFLSPTLNFEVGNVTSLPIVKEDKHAAEIKQLATECELAACQSRDYFETSWNFRGHPLI